MKNIKIDLKGHKITKTLPKDWTTTDKDKPKKELFVLEDFSVYCKKMYDSLLGIKKYYEKEFNEDNTYRIDEYIGLFNSAYEKILKTIISDNETRNNLINWELEKHRNYNDVRFFILENIPRNSACLRLKKNKVAGFAEEYYNKINNYAKQIFMIEKLCSFTTRKFWQNEITKAEDLDLNKKYKILVKCVFPHAWRGSNKSKMFDKYMKSRAYHSTSIIDERHFYSTFFSFTNEYAMLLIDYDDKNFICASPTDSYSEEVIDNKNLIKDKKIFSDVLLQTDENINDQNHKFFAEAVECETPKNLLNNIKFYTEVNLKNIRPKAVIAPNTKSLEFAKEVAKQYGNLPVIKQKDI